MEVERATYPKFRESAALKPHPNAAVEPTFCSLFADEQAWNHRANGFLKGAKLYSRERFPQGKHPLFPPTAGAPYFYDTDQGPKQSLATKLLDAQFSRNHTSWGISRRFVAPPTTCDEKVGPGSYSTQRFPMALASPIRAATAQARYSDRPVTAMEGRWAPRRGGEDGPYGYTNSLTPHPLPGQTGAGEGAGEGDRMAGSGSGFGKAEEGGAVGAPPAGRSEAYRGKPSTAPASMGAKRAASGSGSGSGSGGRRREPAAAGGSRASLDSGSIAGSVHQPRPRTRGELQGLVMQHQRQRAMMQTRRLVKRRVDRETEPLIDKSEANTMTWTRRSAFGGESIARRGHSIPVSPRFGDVLRERKRAAGIPAPGQYYKPSSFLHKSIHKHDPRNDFPTRTKGYRRPGGRKKGRSTTRGGGGMARSRSSAGTSSFRGTSRF